MGYGLWALNKNDICSSIGNHCSEIRPRDPLSTLWKQGRTYKILGHGHLPAHYGPVIKHHGDKIIGD